MSQPIRAKFCVNQLTRYAWTGGFEVTMTPVSSSDPAHENKAFWDATPNGMIKMHIARHEMADHFVLGREYYVDFTPASDQTTTN